MKLSDRATLGMRFFIPAVGIHILSLVKRDLDNDVVYLALIHITLENNPSEALENE